MSRLHDTLYRLPILTLVAACTVVACGHHEDLTATGLLEWDRVELKAEAAEPIVQCFASEGDRLQAGQKVLQLDDRRQRALRDEALAARDQAAARLAELKRGPRGERIDEAQARLRGAESTLETANSELQRVQTLLQRQLSTQEALDAARTQHDRARADRDAAKAALAELLTGATVEELEQADAALKQAAARLQLLEISLQRMTVAAPVDGVLDILPFNRGEQPRVGDTVAVMLAGAAPYARVYVPEPIRARISAGTAAVVHIDGIEQPMHGTVRMISRDAAFTPYYSLTEKDRSRLSFVAEVTISDESARKLSSGVPLRVEFQPDVVAAK